MRSPPDERAIRAQADLIAALFLVALGLAVTWLSWTMDRLEIRHIHPSTIPGLVPFFLGLALSLCGGLLAWRSWRILRPGSKADTLAALWRLIVSPQAARAASVLVLALIYTLVLVKRLPFWLASALFIFSFITLFETLWADQPTRLGRTLFWAALVALVAGLGIDYVFGRVFLVRLP